MFERNKNLSVANLGVTSYSPNIYLSKMKYLLDNNFKFKHLIVFIDISDLYDDNTFYKLNDDFSVSEKNAKEKLLKDSFLTKPISVDVIAEKVLFLASEESQHLNGQIIKIDGKEKL